MTDKSIHSFNIIRYRGQPNKATTRFGLEVMRRQKLWSPLHERLIQCAPYDDHFIFEVPARYKNEPAFQCTCGSVAVVTGMSGYEQDASPQGLMWVCLLHAQTGLHATGGTTWI